MLLDMRFSALYYSYLIGQSPRLPTFLPTNAKTPLNSNWEPQRTENTKISAIPCSTRDCGNLLRPYEITEKLMHRTPKRQFVRIRLGGKIEYF